MCPGECGVDVLYKYVGEAVALVDRDEVYVLAQSLVEKIGPAQCGAPEEDQLLTVASTQRRKEPPSAERRAVLRLSGW